MSDWSFRPCGDEFDPPQLPEVNAEYPVILPKEHEDGEMVIPFIEQSQAEDAFTDHEYDLHLKPDGTYEWWINLPD